MFVEKKRDITVVLDAKDATDLMRILDHHLYDELFIALEGEYIFLSSNVTLPKTGLFIENVRNNNGNLKADDTDVLIYHCNLPVEIKNHLKDNCYADSVVELQLDSTYEKIVGIIG